MKDVWSEHIRKRPLWVFQSAAFQLQQRKQTKQQRKIWILAELEKLISRPRRLTHQPPTPTEKNRIIGPRCVFSLARSPPKPRVYRGLLFAALIQVALRLARTSKQMQFRSSGHNSSCLYMLNLQVEKLHKSHLGDESPASSGERSAVVPLKKEKTEDQREAK